MTEEARTDEQIKRDIVTAFAVRESVAARGHARRRLAADVGPLLARVEEAERENQRMYSALANREATMGERIASTEKIAKDVMAERDAAVRDLARLRDQIGKALAIIDDPYSGGFVGPRVRDALTASSTPEPTKTAAELLREIAARDSEAHNQALARGYGVDRDPEHYPSLEPTTEEQQR